MAHPVVGTTVAGLAALLLLSACAPPAGQESPSPELSPAPSAASAPPSAENAAGTNKYFPVAVGNTWVYDLQDATGTSTLTDTISAVIRDGADVIATIDRTIDHADTATADETTSVDFVFHDDGSVSEPFSYLVAGAPGTLEWPSTADFEAGAPSTGSFAVGAGSVVFSILGQGNESITVPLGTFECRRLVQNLLLSGSGVSDVPWAPSYWLSPGVGIVRAEIPDYIFGGPAAVFELLSFTPGVA